MEKADAKQLLRAKSLRATAPRVALMQLLAEAPRPMAYSEVIERLGASDWDPATMYRNLVTLTDAGLARVVSRAHGMARYELVQGDAAPHAHPHFACTDCGTVTCLPEGTVATITAPGPWGAALENATIQVQGSCPECLQVEPGP